MSLLEFGWRVGLYSQSQGGENHTRVSLQNVVTMKAERLLMEFWPSIGERVFNVGSTSFKKFRDPRVRELLDVLSVELRAHTFKKRSLIAMEIVMELKGGRCYWPT
ncbi:hypothetical protein Tco_0187372, partial [Tanacetum coccineum]